MILRSLELKSFGQFVDKKYEFRRGINLVIGPNEAGKSTMMEAIPAVLFGCKDKKRFRPWARSLNCSAALMLENQKYNITIERDIDTDQVELRQADDLYQEQCNLVAKVPVDDHCADKLDYLHLLKKFLGISDERLFRSSLFLGQGDFPSTAEEIKRHMGILLSGFARGDSNVVLQSIQDDYLAITNDSPWSDRPQTSPRELEAVQDALDEVYVQRARMQQMSDELHQVKGHIEQLQHSLDADREDYEKGVEYLNWIQHQWCQDEADNHQGHGTELPVADESPEISLRQECLQLEQVLADAGLPSEIPVDLPPLLASADEIRCSLVALHQQTLPLRKQLNELVFPRSRRWLLFSLLMVVLLGAVSYFYPQWFVVLSASIGGVLGLCWIRFAWCYRQQRGVKRQLEQQIDAIDLLREQERLRLKELDDEFEGYGFASSAIAMVKMKKQLEGHEHIIKRLTEVRTALQQNNADCPDVAKDKSGCRTTAENSKQQDLEDSDNRVEHPTEHLQPDELPAAKEKLADMKSSIKKREVELLSLLRQEAVLQDRLSDAERLGTTETELRASLAELQERKEVLDCAYNVLAAAIEEFSHTNLRALEKEISRYLRKATMGKYVEVEITENYALRLRRSGQRGKSSALENASRGTIDLVCLATRLALTRFLTHDEYLPFFLDDALINLDSERMVEAVDALERLSKDHQIVMFTHDERLYKLASRRRWHIIPLGLRPKRTKTDKKQEVGGHGGQLSFL